MVCYVPGTGTLAVLGFAVYLVWHRAIMHFLSMVGMAMEVTLLLSAEVAVAIFLIWTARMIRRRRAAAGACTTCRFRCQQAMAPRPNFFVNRVDRRVTPPPVRRPARPATRPRRSCPPCPPCPSGPAAVHRPGTRPSRRLSPHPAGAVPRFPAGAWSRSSAGAAPRCPAGAALRSAGASRCPAGAAPRCPAGAALRSAGAAPRCSAGAAPRCSAGAAPRCSTGRAFRCTAPGTRSPAQPWPRWHPAPRPAPGRLPPRLISGPSPRAKRSPLTATCSLPTGWTRRRTPCATRIPDRPGISMNRPGEI